MLVRLIYASTAAQPVGPDLLSALLKQARMRNALRSLSGLLTFDSDYFLQAIEGSPQAVNDLYASLLRDTRHSNVNLLHYAHIDSRLFPDWKMGFLSANSSHRALYAPMMTGPRFNPYALRGEQAQGLLLELARVSANAGAALA